jgi:hypothetical protein
VARPGQSRVSLRAFCGTSLADRRFIFMYSILIAAILVVAVGSPAIAQEMPTPSTVLGQGFTQHGLQGTSSDPDQDHSVQIPTSSSAELQAYQHADRSSRSNLDWLSAPAASGRTPPERPAGPLRKRRGTGNTYQTRSAKGRGQAALLSTAPSPFCVS